MGKPEDTPKPGGNPDALGGEPYGVRQLRKGTGHQAATRLIEMASGLLVMLLTVRFLSVSEYALYVTCSALATMLGLWSLWGLDRVANRFVPDARLHASPAALRSLVGRLEGLRLIGLILLAMGAWWSWEHVARFFAIEGAVGARAAVMAYALTHGLMQFTTVVMQSLMLQRAIRNAVFTVSILRLLIIGLLVIRGDGELIATDLLWAIAAVELLGIGLMQWPTWRELRTLPVRSGRDDWYVGWRRMIRLGMENFIMGQAAITSQPKLQQLAAAAVLPTEMVAAFGFYRNLADQLGRLLPFNMFRSLLEPVLIGRYLASNDLSALAQSRRLLLKLNLMAGLPLVAIVFTVADPLMAVVTDGRYVAELWMLPLLLLGAVANAQKTLSVVSANATDLSAWLTPAALAGSASVLALWLAHGVLGPVVLCVSDLVFCAVFSATVAWVLARYRGSVSGWHLGGLAKMSLALLLALVMGWMLNRSVELERSWASAAASLFVGLGFFTAAFILKPFSDRERASLNSIYPRLKWPF